MKRTLFSFGFLLIGITLFAGGNKEPQFVLANGTGYTIKKIEIRPSSKDYPKNNITLSVSDHDIIDKGLIEIFLGEDMIGYSLFDIAIQYDSDSRDDKEKLKWIRTKNAISIKGKNSVPVFSLSIHGEKNTLANIIGGTVAGAAAPAVIAIVASAIVGAPVIVVGAPVILATALVGGAFVGFSPFVSANLITEELGNYKKLKKTLGK
jgi:hypothetical protein